MKAYSRISASVFALLTTVIAGCGGDSGSNEATSIAVEKRSLAAQLGKQLFEDKALSASGIQSCSTCHDPNEKFVDTKHDVVPLGGPNMDLPGFRNTPSILYSQFIPSFHIEADGTPVGGQFRDGRVNSFTEQAQKPFTGSFEMANKDASEVIERLKTRPYLQTFTALYGSAVLDDPDQALQRMAMAIAAFETEASEFHPFSSKFDYWVKGQAQLSNNERNGLRLFNDPTKGNCAACHPSSPANGVAAMFTDFSYDNLGVPRNPNIEANNNATTLNYVPFNGDGKHAYYDLGLCGPIRDDLSGNTTLCGAFRVPSLRNVAATAPYFHNGRFSTLQETLKFYVRRDTNPEEFYPKNEDGTVDKFDDLPAAYRANVNTTEVPYNRKLGEQPSLNDAEINDVIAFLCTLTDGYDPANPDAYVLPAQCTPSASTVSISSN